MLLLNEIVSFFNYEPLVNTVKADGFRGLLSLDGLVHLAAFALPVLLILELIAIVILRKFCLKKYKVTFLIYVVNAFISKLIVIDAMAFSIQHFEKYTLFKMHVTWYWFLYSYLIWELSQFIYHYSSHKIRLLWCMHSTHHAVEYMNLSVAYSGFFLQGTIAYAIRITVCTLLGVSLPMLLLIMAIDGLWGGIVHIGEEVLRDGRLGTFNKFILTPSHHRVHHARNPEYIDKNFCNFLNVWDKIFGTYQKQLPNVLPEYGIVRKIDANNFLDIYFSEFFCLWDDIKHAPGIKCKFLYIIMPPGWRHG